MLLLFCVFHLIWVLKTGCFFHVICFLRTGCFFQVICFIKTGCFKCCLFWLLSILCFVYIVASSVEYNGLLQTLLFFSFFASYVSSKVVVFFHVICFLRTACFFSCHMFHQNWLIQMFGVWLILL